MYLSTENNRKIGIKKGELENRSDIEWRVSHEASFGILVCFMLLLSGTSVSFAQSENEAGENRRNNAEVSGTSVVSNRN